MSATTEATKQPEKAEENTRKIDPEISAMKKVGNILDNLDTRQRRRVLGWALDRYGRINENLASTAAPGDGSV